LLRNPKAARMFFFFEFLPDFVPEEDQRTPVFESGATVNISWGRSYALSGSTHASARLALRDLLRSPDPEAADIYFCLVADEPDALSGSRAGDLSALGYAGVSLSGIASREGADLVDHSLSVHDANGEMVATLVVSIVARQVLTSILADRA